MIKSVMDSVVTSINVRIDSVIQDVAQLKASLEFSQKDLSDHAEKIKSRYRDIEKTVYLENQSRRNNLRFEGLLEDDNETWDKTEAKVKNVLAANNSILNLLRKLNVLIAQVVLGGMMELQNR